MVPDLKHLDDIERNPEACSVIQPDPYCFRDSLKTDSQLAEIRRRHKTGKRVERYHRRQNDVMLVFLSCMPIANSPKLITSLLKPMEEHTEQAKASEDHARLRVRVRDPLARSRC
jgi:hypothetical protein